MFAATLITLRETLEASLIVGIMLAYLDKIERRKSGVVVWSGVFAGMCGSLGVAVLLGRATEHFEGATEQIYEGSTMLVASALLTWMILWMLGRRGVRGSLETKVQTHVTNEYVLGLFLLAFFSTMREALETVIFLKALILQTNGGLEVFGGLLGIAIAVGLSYFLFRGIEVLPMKKFFAVTSLLLIFFAAGLVLHGVMEFQEAGLLPFLDIPLWNTNAVLNEESNLGGILKSLFGYSGSPSGLAFVSYVVYLTGMLFVYFRPKKSPVRR